MTRKEMEADEGREIKGAINPRNRAEAQRQADEAVYGKDSMLSEIAAERRARIYDVDTTKVPENKQGIDTRLENDGIDRIDYTSPTAGGGGGLPDGYEEALRQYVDENNEAQQEYYLVREA
jgi:hypothetical protein